MTQKLTNETAGKRLAHRLFSLFATLPLLLALSSYSVAAPIKPQAVVPDSIRTVLVVPVESPPLEVIPDLIEMRMPVYAHLKNMSLPLYLDEKIYRHPGGVLIAGLVGNDDDVQVVTFDQGRGAGLESAARASAHWTPTLELAKNAAAQLNAHGIKAIASSRYYRLPIRDRTAYIGHWRMAVGQWYRQAVSPVDYRALEPVDAVLELGIGRYRIFEGQTSVQILLKLVDPKSGQVIARTDKNAFSVEDSAQALLGREAEPFKALIAEIGARLLGQGFGEIGLTQGRLVLASLKNDRFLDD